MPTLPRAHPAPRRRSDGRRLLGTCLACAATVVAPAEGQILTENAGPASPELPSVRASAAVRETRNVSERRLEAQFTWSPCPVLETRTTVPWVARDFGAEQDAGLGDIALRLKQSLWQRDDVVASTRLAALYEVAFPTGSTDDARDASGRPLPRKLQLGAGALGLGGGAAFTLIRDRHRFSAEAFYRHTFRDDGFALGDSLRGNLAYWFRLTPAVFRAGPAGRDPLEVRGVLEVLSAYRFESSQAGSGGLDDQGSEVWLAPGLQLFGRARILFEASVQVPIHQVIDDAFGRREWGATLAVKILF